MITLLLAWIHAVYKQDFELLFGGAVIIDLFFIVFLLEASTK